MSSLMSGDDLIDFDLLKKLKKADTRQIIIDNKKKIREELALLDWDGWAANDIVSKIIQDGDIELIIWINEYLCPWDYVTFNIAVQFGKLEIMKF